MVLPRSLRHQKRKKAQLMQKSVVSLPNIRVRIQSTFHITRNWDPLWRNMKWLSARHEGHEAYSP